MLSALELLALDAHLSPSSEDRFYVCKTVSLPLFAHTARHNAVLLVEPWLPFPY